MKKLSILILAAGKGTRMKSALPKVLHPVGGTPLVHHVLKTVHALKPVQVSMIVGHQSDAVRTSVKSISPKIFFFEQTTLDGSGGAVRRALSWLKKQKGDVLVTCGDTPLLTTATLSLLAREHRRQKNSATVLSTLMPNPHGYGRIIRQPDDSVEKIVEELDASLSEKQVKEINTGTYVFNAKSLTSALPKLKANNAKKEYYLTDVLEILKQQGLRIGAVITADVNESWGMNRRQDLALAEAVLRQRKCEQLMTDGVTLIDPATTYIDTDVKIGADTVIYPNTVIRGKTVIGSGCQIGPWSHISSCEIKDNVVLLASFADDSKIESGARVGPYSRIRPGSDLGENTHVGNFSEVKKTKLGAGSKVNHLSYLGDATVGKCVNIGAGSITCNYDGIVKSPTFIEDHSFVGSNVNLIAPVRIGAHSVIGAGSSINQDVPAWSLAVERSKTILRPDWAKSKFSSKNKKIASRKK